MRDHSKQFGKSIIRTEKSENTVEQEETREETNSEEQENKESE